MAVLLWNDVRVLNPTTGLYEAYVTRGKTYTPGTTGVSCQNGTGWEQCAFIGNGSFAGGGMFVGITPLMGQYIRYQIPGLGTPETVSEIIKIVDENEFNTGQIQTPTGYYPPGTPTPCSPTNIYNGAPSCCGCLVNYNTLGRNDYGSILEFTNGLPTIDFITYCCKKATNYSPMSLSMVCVGGCTDPIALNYDPTQIIDDGSCTYNGCMDILAANYNPQAIYDNGSCVYAGCTDPLASNYDPVVTIDDGSCQCIKCCEKVSVLGVVSHMLLSNTTSPCQCPSGWYDVTCGQYLGWECDPNTSTCALVPNGAYSSQTECNIDCESCGCTKLLGTGNTSAYAIALSADCEEYCCDPDLRKCDILVVGDDEGIQVYNPTNDTTSHLFDSNYADILDITATRSGNNGFIWVHKHSGGGGSDILEYAITMVPFTTVFVRQINVGATVLGKGMTYFGNDSLGRVVLTIASQASKVQNITLPIGTTSAPAVSMSTEYILPSGYNCTGDLLTEGYMSNTLDVVLYDNGTTYKVGIISRNTGVVLDEHTISPTIMTGTTKFEGLFVNPATLPGIIYGVTTDGRIYELLQNVGGFTPGLQFALTPTGQVEFINNITNTVYGADNLHNNNELCTRRAIQMPDSFDCVVSQGGCWDPGTGLGQYSSLADCQAFCIVTWDCNPGSTAGNCKVIDGINGHIINTNFVDRVKRALQHISMFAHGMQGINFNFIGWPNVLNPSQTIPGICYMPWGTGGPTTITFQQKWKIKFITCKFIDPGAQWYTWKAFVVAAGNATSQSFNATLTYDDAQAWLYGTYGFMPANQIKIEAEPCICFSHKCECVPLLGPTGQYINEINCLSVPCCPCKKCCRKKTPPYNTIWLPTTLYPCKCPPGYNNAQCLLPHDDDDHGPQLKLAPAITCIKTCTNGSYYIPLETDDEHCDCGTYGLQEAPQQCDKCCTDGTITKKLALYSTICECDTGWWECNTTPTCDKLCISTSKETNKRLYKPEWPECECPVGYKLYIDDVVKTITTSGKNINCSKCSGGELVTKTFGSETCPDSWSLSVSFIGGCREIDYPPVKPTTKNVEVSPIVKVLEKPILSTEGPEGYVCTTNINVLVGEKQQSCVPSSDGGYKTIEACLSSGCGGFMSCNEGLTVNGVSFKESSYAPIVMCCESVINTSYQKLTQDYCTSACKKSSTYSTEPWYPLYNAFGPNTIQDSLLSYMLRELLEPIRNKECSVNTESFYTSQGFARIK